MRKILFSALLLGLSGGLHAQIGKGAMAVTGIIGISGNTNSATRTDNTNMTTNTTFDQKTRAYAFVPSFSYFLTDRIEAGIALALMKNTTTSNYHPQNVNPSSTASQKNENPLNAFGILANYYLINEARYAWYAGLQFAVGSGTGRSTNTLVNGISTVSETKNNGTTLGLNTGFLYFVNTKLALNANFGMLSITSIRTENTNNNITTKTKNSSWELGVNGVMINIGLKYFISGPVLRTNA